MLFSKFSLRAGVILSIGLMGLGGLILAIATGELYRHYALEHERAALGELLQLETNTQIKQHEKRIGELALALQNEEQFKTSFTDRDIRSLEKIVNSQFHQYFITTRILDVAKIIVMDDSMNLVAASTDGYLTYDSKLPCLDFFALMKNRSLVDRIRIKSDFCEINGFSYHIVISPIGSVTPIGFIVVIANPSTIFQHVEKTLGLPVMADLHNEVNLYISEKWSNQWLIDTTDNVMIADLAIPNLFNKESFHIHVARDVTPLDTQLNKIRLYIFIVSVIVTVLSALAIITFVNRIIVDPINKLGSHLAKIRVDKFHLGEMITITSSKEIENLAENFNAMSKELKKLYESLETLAYTDSLTHLGNRSQLSRSLEYYIYMGQQQKIPFALFLMDLNEFKSVNDLHGHQSGDEVLQQVSERLRKVLRKSDVVTNVSMQDANFAQGDNVARLGGDEFAAILPSLANTDDALKIAGKIVHEVSKPIHLQRLNLSFNVGISIGIAIFPNHGADAHEIMRHADDAMYAAKKSGTGIAIYNSTLNIK